MKCGIFSEMAPPKDTDVVNDAIALAKKLVLWGNEDTEARNLPMLKQQFFCNSTTQMAELHQVASPGSTFFHVHEKV